jgi:hypothetical protein
VGLIVIVAARGEILAVIIGIHEDGEDGLAHIALAGGPMRIFLGGSESREEHRRQNADNGDDHEQFNQRERFSNGRFRKGQPPSSTRHHFNSSLP